MCHFYYEEAHHGNHRTTVTHNTDVRKQRLLFLCFCTWLAPNGSTKRLKKPQESILDGTRTVPRLTKCLSIGRRIPMSAPCVMRAGKNSQPPANINTLVVWEFVTVSEKDTKFAVRITCEAKIKCGGTTTNTILWANFKTDIWHKTSALGHGGRTDCPFQGQVVFVYVVYFSGFRFSLIPVTCVWLAVVVTDLSRYVPS